MAEVNEMPNVTNEVQEQQAQMQVQNALNNEKGIWKLLQWLKELLAVINAHKAYTQKDIKNLQKKIDNINTALENGGMSEEQVSRIAEAVYCGIKNVDQPSVVKEQLDVAEITATSRAINRMKGEEIHYLVNDDKCKVFFAPLADSKTMALVMVNEGKVSWYRDVEDFKAKANVSFTISSNEFVDKGMTQDEIHKDLFDSIKGDIDKLVVDSKEALMTKELTKVADKSYLDEVASTLNSRPDLNLEVIVNEKDSTIFVTEKDSENPRNMLLVVSKDEYGINQISSIRMIEDKEFNPMEFNKEEVLEESEALMYRGKVPCIDAESGQWTVKEDWAFAQDETGIALEVVNTLKEGLEVEEVREDFREEVEEALENDDKDIFF